MFLSVVVCLFIVPFTQQQTILSRFGFYPRLCLCRCGIPNTEYKPTFKQLNNFTYNETIFNSLIEPHEYPWVAMIFVDGISKGEGILISSKYVLSAASPLFGYAPASVKVSLGMHDRCEYDTTSTNFSVSAITNHPLYSNSQNNNDLTLLTLISSIIFDSSVHPICIPPAARIYKGQVTVLSSWVKEYSNCVPKKSRMPVLTTLECFLSLSNKTKYLLTPDKSCIGYSSKGPAVKSVAGAGVQFLVNDRFYLLGIVSDQGYENNPSNSILFTRIADHLKWLASQTEDDCFCTRCIIQDEEIKLFINKPLRSKTFAVENATRILTSLPKPVFCKEGANALNEIDNFLYFVKNITIN